MNFEDLNYCYFKHGGGLGELRSLWEPTYLIDGMARLALGIG